MKKLFFILTFNICFFCLMSVSKAQETCSAAAAPTVEFKTSYGKLQYDFSLSHHEITALAKQTGSVENGFWADGLAPLTIKSFYEIHTYRYSLPDKSICVIPKKIMVYIGYSDPKIYVANDVRPGSCRYNLVLRHEQTHQQINISVLNYYLPLLNRAAKKIAATLKPVIVKNPDKIKEVSDNFFKQFSNKFTPLVNLMDKERKLEQQKLDNRHNYTMETNICIDFEQKAKSRR